MYISEVVPPRPPLPGGEVPPPRPPPPETDDEDDMFMHAPLPNQPILVNLFNFLYRFFIIRKNDDEWYVCNTDRLPRMVCTKKYDNGRAKTTILLRLPKRWRYSWDVCRSWYVVKEVLNGTWSRVLKRSPKLQKKWLVWQKIWLANVPIRECARWGPLRKYFVEEASTWFT